jgi:hypothetical protein
MNVSGAAATPAIALAVHAKISGLNVDTDGARGNLSKAGTLTPAAAKAASATITAARAAKATAAARAAAAAKAAQQTTAETPASRSAATSLTGVGTKLDARA